MDVVYIVGPGDSNQQLRYSLRSLANFPHNRVWMFGHKPPWATNVEHVEVGQNSHNHVNTWAAWQALAKQGPVSFALFNDDFYVTEKIKRPPVEHRGPLGENITRLNTRRLQAWHGRAVATHRALHDIGVQDPLYYELHTPLPMRRVKLAAALDALERVRTQGLARFCKRTWYGNHADIGGAERRDCKIHSHSYVNLDSHRPYLSTSDTAWRGHTGRAIEAMFPTPSPYERQP